MKGPMKILVLVVVAAVAVAAGVYVYFLMQPRISLLVYPDSKVTGTKERTREMVILHVRNDGTMDLYINATTIDRDPWTTSYTFQSDIVIPVGVEAVITFPAGGGEIKIETISGPSVASGGVYAISDNPEPNPFGLGTAGLIIYTKAGRTGGYWSSTPIALVEE